LSEAGAAQLPPIAPADAPHPSALPLSIIEPPRGWRLPRLGEIWRHRELLLTLVHRDLRVRYRQTLLGVLWALVQPVTQLVIFALVFGRLARLPSEGTPYALFVFVGLLPWAYFSAALTRVAGSVVGSGHLLTKVWFPRLIVPLAGTVTPLLDFLLSLMVLAALLAWYGTPPGWPVLALPGFLALAWAAALGVGLWFAALDAHYRDATNLLPWLTQVWLYATPIVYPASLVPDPYRPWLGLNPMAGVVEGFRWALLDRGRPPGPEIAVSAGVALLLLASGLLFFERMERTFADVV
jgi:lipopolysaccharide transport system permease protein